MGAPLVSPLPAGKCRYYPQTASYACADRVRYVAQPMQPTIQPTMRQPRMQYPQMQMPMQMPMRSVCTVGGVDAQVQSYSMQPKTSPPMYKAARAEQATEPHPRHFGSKQL